MKPSSQIKSEKDYNLSILEQVPVGITIFRGADFVVEMANDTYLEIVDRKRESFVGKTLFESLPEVKESVEGLLNNVYTTGEPYNGYEFPVTLFRHGRAELTFFNFVYKALREPDGTISGIIVLANEVTDTVQSRNSLTKSAHEFRNMVMQSPIAMTTLRGPQFIIEIANKVLIETIWRKKPEEVLNKPILEVFPELMDQKYPELLKKVYDTGIFINEKESIAYVNGEDGMRKYYLDYQYAPLIDVTGQVDGIMITVNDVTEKVEARLKVEDAEERLRLAVTATGLAHWSLDIDTRHLIYSPRLAEIFGRPGELNLTQDQLRASIMDEDRTQVEKAFAEALQTGTYKYDARVKHPDGKIVWIRTHGKLFMNTENYPVRLLGAMWDVTDEKQHQQELFEREEKFRLLADSLPELVWLCDAEGDFNYFNHSFLNYTDIPATELFANGWISLLHPTEQLKAHKLWKKCLAASNNFTAEYRLRNKSGNYRWHIVHAHPQKSDNGTVQMWVGNMIDIQDQKLFTEELEKQVYDRTQELQENNRELEKMNAELKSFAYVSSHDLQEPLRKTQIFVSKILEQEEENLSEFTRNYIMRIQNSANRMQKLIEDLLSYSRTNTTDKVFVRSNINDYVTDVLAELNETIIAQHAVIKVGKLCQIDIIPFQFRQLLNNLIGNSLKFSKADTVPQIKISAKQIAGKSLKFKDADTNIKYCHLSIADNGIGFLPEYKNKIFEVFQRLHTREEYKGTGIGLAIVKKIVNNHNGFITADGKPGKGARFDIYIPLRNQ